MANTIYGVVYPGGGYGTFIKSMLIYILTDDVVDMDFTDGSSHSYYYKSYAHKMWSGVDRLLLRTITEKNIKKYSILGKIPNINFPLVETPVLPLDLDLVYKNNLTYKLIYIDLHRNELPDIIANHFYKQPDTRTHFAALANKLFHTSELEELDRLQLVSLFNHPDTISSYDGYLTELVSFIDTCPNQYKNILYKIEYCDIINNPNKIKNLLETVTGKKISDRASTQYSRFVQRQIDFKKEKGI